MIALNTENQCISTVQIGPQLFDLYGSQQTYSQATTTTNKQKHRLHSVKSEKPTTVHWSDNTHTHTLIHTHTSYRYTHTLLWSDNTHTHELLWSDNTHTHTQIHAKSVLVRQIHTHTHTHTLQAFSLHHQKFECMYVTAKY